MSRIKYNCRASTSTAGDVALLVDKIACESDRNFFQHHLGRSHRLRPAWDLELEEFEQKFSFNKQPAIGFCWWVAVKQIKSGIRIRKFFQVPIKAPVGDIPEDIAKRIWALTAPKQTLPVEEKLILEFSDQSK